MSILWPMLVGLLVALSVRMFFSFKRQASGIVGDVVAAIVGSFAALLCYVPGIAPDGNRWTGGLILALGVCAVIGLLRLIEILVLKFSTLKEGRGTR